MGLAATLTAGAGAIQAGGQIASSAGQAAYQNAQARQVMRQAELDRLATERQINYDTQAAASQIDALRRQGRQNFGAQLAAMAAGGMSTLSGSAQDIVASSARSEDRDVSNINLQNARSAYERRLQSQLNLYDVQAQATGLRASARAARTGGYVGAFGTLLGTAAQVYGMTYQPKAKKGQTLEGNIREYGKNNAPWSNFGGGIY